MRGQSRVTLSGVSSAHSARPRTHDSAVLAYSRARRGRASHHTHITLSHSRLSEQHTMRLQVQRTLSSQAHSHTSCHQAEPEDAHVLVRRIDCAPRSNVCTPAGPAPVRPARSPIAPCVFVRRNTSGRVVRATKTVRRHGRHERRIVHVSASRRGRNGRLPRAQTRGLVGGPCFSREAGGAAA